MRNLPKLLTSFTVSSYAVKSNRNIGLPSFSIFSVIAFIFFYLLLTSTLFILGKTTKKLQTKNIKNIKNGSSQSKKNIKMYIKTSNNIV